MDKIMIQMISINYLKVTLTQSSDISKFQRSKWFFNMLMIINQ